MSQSACIDCVETSDAEIDIDVGDKADTIDVCAAHSSASAAVAVAHILTTNAALIANATLFFT
jgi:hypothetical protein